MDDIKYLFKSIRMDLKDLCRGLTVNNSGEYVVPTCPACEEYLGITDNYKLYIKSDFKIGYCQRCKSKFFNESSPENNIIEDYKIPQFKFNNSTCDFELLKVDCSYYDYSKDYDETCINYLIGRNKDLGTLYKKLRFKFRTQKVVMPCIWNDEVIFYQVRNCEKEKSFRSFYLPPTKNKPIWVNPLNNYNEPNICICEGIFGAIGAWLNYKGKLNTCSVFGGSITKYQLWMLNQLCFSEVYLYFDELELNYHNRSLITGFVNRPINLYSIRSELHDPEDDYVCNKSDLSILKIN